MLQYWSVKGESFPRSSGFNRWVRLKSSLHGVKIKFDEVVLLFSYQDTKALKGEKVS